MTATELENIRDNEESEDEYGNGYYDRIDEEGILPSNHLRACYGCMVTIVNGQFYGYWQEIVNHRLASGMCVSYVKTVISILKTQLCRLSR